MQMLVQLVELILTANLRMYQQVDSITRVYVKNASGYFEAFPMAKDEEIQDSRWDYGFSYNLDDESMPEELYVYSNENETWTRLTPVINN